MKRRVAITLIALFAAGVTADDVYHGLAKNSPDLTEPHLAADQRVAVQHGVGDSIDVHGGLGPGNPDLVTRTGSGRAANQSSRKANNFYGGFCGSSEIPC